MTRYPLRQYTTAFLFLTGHSHIRIDKPTGLVRVFAPGDAEEDITLAFQLFYEGKSRFLPIVDMSLNYRPDLDES